MKKSETYTDTGKIFLYPSATAAWHFVPLSKPLTATLRATYGKGTRGCGMLPVEVTIGTTTWKTSVFYSKQPEGYMLPLKAAVRRKEYLYEEDKVTFSFTVGTS